MTVRKAEEKDADKLLDLLSQVLEIHASIRPDTFVPGQVKFGRASLSGMIESENDPVYVAVDENDAVVGYVFCRYIEKRDCGYMRDQKYLYIEDLCVDVSFRGKGVGEALFRYAADRARENGCYEVNLNVWEGNDRAKRFYEKMGMTVRSTLMEYIL